MDIDRITSWSFVSKVALKILIRLIRGYLLVLQPLGAAASVAPWTGCLAKSAPQILHRGLVCQYVALNMLTHFSHVQATVVPVYIEHVAKRYVSVQKRFQENYSTNDEHWGYVLQFCNACLTQLLLSIRLWHSAKESPANANLTLSGRQVVLQGKLALAAFGNKAWF